MEGYQPESRYLNGMGAVERCRLEKGDATTERDEALLYSCDEIFRDCRGPGIVFWVRAVLP